MLSDVFQRGLGDIAFLALRQVQQRHDRRAFLLRRIFRKDLFYFLGIFFSKHKTSHLAMEILIIMEPSGPHLPEQYRPNR